VAPSFALVETNLHLQILLYILVFAHSPDLGVEVVVLHCKSVIHAAKIFSSSDSDAGSATPAIIAREFSKLLSSRHPVKALENRSKTLDIGIWNSPR
jgi:hypothetical protein